jgi:hypothetical protein
MSETTQTTLDQRHPLDRLLSPIEPIALRDPSWWPEQEPEDPRVECRIGRDGPGWLRSRDWRLFARAALDSGEGPEGEEIESFVTDSGRTIRSQHTPEGRVVIPFGLADAYSGYTAELWAEDPQQLRLHPRLLDAFYRLKGAIPRPIQLAARRALIRGQGRPEFPRWPFDASLAELLRFYVRCALVAEDRKTLRFRWFWPDGARAAVILTHDVESAAGLRNAAHIADLEETRGLRSSFNIVASEYPIDWGIIEELRQRGFELGVHGVFHDRSLFSSRQEFDRQLPALREMRERLGAEGFRSPATHRVSSWLADLPVSYDCTVPMSDPYEPQPGGCCSPWPFFFGDVLELPYTLPQDHTTFTLLRETTIDLWLRQLDLVEESAGLAQCLSHPDPGYLGEPDKEALYAEFLDAVAERTGVWTALPREVAAWWRKRDDDGSDPEPGEAGIATLDETGSVSLTHEADRGGSSDPGVPWRTADQPLA